MPGFVVGYQAANGGSSIREDVPRGETVEAWTRMVTTQRFAGIAARVSPAALAARIAGMVEGGCVGATVSPVRTLTVSGRPAARMHADCPMNKGAPESFVFLAVAGASDMHVKQAAVRGPGAPRRLAWGDTLLAATRLCDAASTELVCRTR